MKKLVLGCLLASMSPFVFAGGHGTDGGDICEKEFKKIRDEIKSWIQRDGHLGLKLPDGISHSFYKSEMLSKMDSAVISCDDKKKVLLGVEKVCLNNNEGGDTISCNDSRFNKLTLDYKYQKVHHEYASLAGIEDMRNKIESRYETSDQVSYIVEEKVIGVLPISYELEEDVFNDDQTNNYKHCFLNKRQIENSEYTKFSKEYNSILFNLGLGGIACTRYNIPETRQEAIQYRRYLADQISKALNNDLLVKEYRQRYLLDMIDDPESSFRTLARKMGEIHPAFLEEMNQVLEAKRQEVMLGEFEYQLPEDLVQSTVAYYRATMTFLDASLTANGYDQDTFRIAFSSVVSNAYSYFEDIDREADSLSIHEFKDSLRGDFYFRLEPFLTELGMFDISLGSYGAGNKINKNLDVEFSNGLVLTIHRRGHLLLKTYPLDIDQKSLDRCFRQRWVKNMFGDKEGFENAIRGTFHGKHLALTEPQSGGVVEPNFTFLSNLFSGGNFDNLRELNVKCKTGKNDLVVDYDTLEIEYSIHRKNGMSWTDRYIEL